MTFVYRSDKTFKIYTQYGATSLQGHYNLDTESVWGPIQCKLQFFWTDIRMYWGVKSYLYNINKRIWHQNLTKIYITSAVSAVATENETLYRAFINCMVFQGTVNAVATVHMICTNGSILL